MAKKTGLGQGVGLLFGGETEKFFECDIEKILPNKLQPRTHFDEGELSELSDSIKEKGVIQPLIVMKSKDADIYELIAGERRLRASKLAGLITVPVVVMDVTDEDSLLELALIENIQRTDLNPIEEAEAYRSLIDRFEYTQDEAAKRVGKNRSTVANLLRLLNLPKNIQQDLIDKSLSEGHARALLRLSEEPLKLEEVRNQVVADGMTVRQTEKLVKKIISNTRTTVRKTRATESAILPDSYKKSLTIQLTNRLNSKVAIVEAGSRGKIEIEYYSHDDLERVMQLLMGD